MHFHFLNPKPVWNPDLSKSAWVWNHTCAVWMPICLMEFLPAVLIAILAGNFSLWQNFFNCWFSEDFVRIIRIPCVHYPVSLIDRCEACLYTVLRSVWHRELHGYAEWMMLWDSHRDVTEMQTWRHVLPQCCYCCAYSGKKNLSAMSFESHLHDRVK